ncbi:MAG: tRNA (adenosine(37)-N6)-threonylcarbamoyltransferase complex ATPase subunit type 1 TsaE [Bacteroidia bacterium]|nr:MAG: tRNA (adenosine(37)-N6)-threonylcarbamoyltransferase complex ATPase subunit type 1 TsaE [Bacteroidia bacterium]
MSHYAIPLPGLKDLPQAAARFDELAAGHTLIAFWGGMGFGKTTFIKALARRWGVVDTVTSPTFSIVNEYRTRAGGRVYHMDFYRLSSIEEALDLGLDDYLHEPGARVLMEWPSVVEPLLPAERLDVTLRVDDRGQRTLHLDL